MLADIPNKLTTETRRQGSYDRRRGRWLFFAVAAVAASVLLTYVVGLMVNDTPTVNDTPMATTVASDGCFNAEAFDAYNGQAVAAFEEAGRASLSGDTTGSDGFRACATQPS